MDGDDPDTDNDPDTEGGGGTGCLNPDSTIRTPERFVAENYLYIYGGNF